MEVTSQMQVPPQPVSSSSLSEQPHDEALHHQHHHQQQQQPVLAAAAASLSSPSSAILDPPTALVADTVAVAVPEQEDEEEPATVVPPHHEQEEQQAAEVRAVIVAQSGYHLYHPPVVEPWISPPTVPAAPPPSSQQWLQSPHVDEEEEAKEEIVHSEDDPHDSQQQQQQQGLHSSSSTAVSPSWLSPVVSNTTAIAVIEEPETAPPAPLVVTHESAVAAASVPPPSLAGMPTYHTDTSSSVVEPVVAVLEEPNHPGGSTTVPSAVAAAVAAPSSVFSSSSTSFHALDDHGDPDHDSELAALKRAALFGRTTLRETTTMAGSSFPNSSNLNHHTTSSSTLAAGCVPPQPHFPDEDLDLYFARTCEFWNAVALDQYSHCSSNGSIRLDGIMEDSMRLARQYYSQAFSNSTSSSPWVSSSYDENPCEESATVVEITHEPVHPSDLSAVRAEWVGPADPVSTTTTTTTMHTPEGPPPVAAAATAAASMYFDETAEATVIDSVPASKAEGQVLWQQHEQQHLPPHQSASEEALYHHHHAQVLSSNPDTVETEDMSFHESCSSLDRKPPAVDRSVALSTTSSNPSVVHDDGTDASVYHPLAVSSSVAAVAGVATAVVSSDNHHGGTPGAAAAVADPEAEVVRIEEEDENPWYWRHPLEQPSQHDRHDEPHATAQAEPVGTDYTYSAESDTTVSRRAGHENNTTVPNDNDYNHVEVSDAVVDTTDLNYSNSNNGDTEAQVVCIEEDDEYHHPTEHLEDAQAQPVGTSSYNYASATAVTDEHDDMPDTSSSLPVESTTAIVVEETEVVSQSPATIPSAQATMYSPEQPSVVVSTPVTTENDIVVATPTELDSSSTNGVIYGMTTPPPASSRPTAVLQETWETPVTATATPSTTPLTAESTADTSNVHAVLLVHEEETPVAQGQRVDPDMTNSVEPLPVEAAVMTTPIGDDDNDEATRSHRALDKLSWNDENDDQDQPHRPESTSDSQNDNLSTAVRSGATAMTHEAGTSSSSSQGLPPRVPPPSSAFSSASASHGRSHGDTVPEWLRETPPPPTRATIRDSDRQETTQSTTSSNASQRSQLQLVSERASQMTAHLARSTGNVMESLFGEAKPPLLGRRGRATTNDVAQSITPRTLLPWSVIQNSSNRTWVATLQTNQKALDSKNVKEASKSLKAFSLPSEKQAICLAKSWTPPRMVQFKESPSCHICRVRFAILRRPCHCRNCGVCICKDCAAQWPSKMIPETYNIKKESMVHSCKACDWLCNSFRLALLEGKMDEAVALHATGNVNLTTPFANVKGEEFYPVHCAVLGGNLMLLKWLVDDNCCPIKSVRVSGKAKELSNRYTPIVTSKGRSLLGIAMENEVVDIVRYLVVNKGISIAGEKDVTPGMLMRNLDKVLRLMPDATRGNSQQGRRSPHAPAVETELPPEESPSYNAAEERALYESMVAQQSLPPPSAPAYDPDEHAYGLRDDAVHSFGSPGVPQQSAHRRAPTSSNTGTSTGMMDSQWEQDLAGTSVDDNPSVQEGKSGESKEDEDDDEECIICYDNKIDCVATPCGHQMCCLKCSKNISRCPVCAQDCGFLRVFRP